jgi:hypothetical protein
MLVLPPAAGAGGGLAQDLDDLIGTVDVDRDARDRAVAVAGQFARLGEGAGHRGAQERAEAESQDFHHGRPRSLLNS